MRNPIPVVLATCLALSGPAVANDGFGGLSSTGLTFGQTDAIAMVEEDLFIGLDAVRVDYLFRNITGSDVTGEVIFPLPPIHVGGLMMSDWNLPDDLLRENLVGFTATVDGAPVSVSVDRQAVIEPPWEERGPASAAYDAPGRDVTADLQRLGVSLTVEPTVAVAALKATPSATRARIAAEGLAEFYPSAENPDEIYPAWSIVLRYHWTQTFPAGADLRISHSYDHLPPGGIFVWQDPPKDDYLRQIADRYCVDGSTSRGITRRLQGGSSGDGYYTGMAWNIDYVLRTANSWAGPIGRFRLTLDKGSERNIISLCATGIEKTGPTTFVMEKRDFVPDRDLEILIVSPLEN